MLIATTDPTDPYVTDDDQPRTALSDLATALTDTVEGYAVMADKAAPDVQPVLERFLALHRAHMDRLRALIDEQGGDPTNAGSMLGTVHKVLAHTRDTLGRLDDRPHDIILRTEARVEDRYQTARDALDEHAVIQSVLAAQHAALREHVNALKY